MFPNEYPEPTNHKHIFQDKVANAFLAIAQNYRCFVHPNKDNVVRLFPPKSPDLVDYFLNKNVFDWLVKKGFIEEFKPDDFIYQSSLVEKQYKLTEKGKKLIKELPSVNEGFQFMEKFKERNVNAFD